MELVQEVKITPLSLVILYFIINIFEERDRITANDGFAA